MIFKRICYLNLLEFIFSKRYVTHRAILAFVLLYLVWLNIFGILVFVSDSNLRIVKLSEKIMLFPEYILLTRYKAT